MILRARSAACAVILLVTVFGLPSSGSAVPVQGPTGNYYEFVTAPFATWPDARAAALGSSYLGQPGYLATVTSAPENAFLAALSPTGWLGGSDQASEGTWVWVDGPEAGQVFWVGGPGGSAPPGAYANWQVGQPDNGGGVQDFLTHPLSWDDYLGTQDGYFVEYAAVVPEPATLVLLGSTFAGVGLAQQELGHGSGHIQSEGSRATLGWALTETVSDSARKGSTDSPRHLPWLTRGEARPAVIQRP
jgi:hypothetical protein